MDTYDWCTLGFWVMSTCTWTWCAWTELLGRAVTSLQTGTWTLPVQDCIYVHDFFTWGLLEILYGAWYIHRFDVAFVEFDCQLDWVWHEWWAFDGLYAIKPSCSTEIMTSWSACSKCSVKVPAIQRYVLSFSPVTSSNMRSRGDKKRSQHFNDFCSCECSVLIRGKRATLALSF